MKPGEFSKKIKEGNLGDVLFVYGDDQYTLGKVMKELLEAIVREPYEMNLDICSKNDSLGVITQKAEQMPCFAPKRVVVIENSALFSGGDAGEIVNYLKDKPESTILVFRYDGLPDKRRALYKALSKNADVCEALQMNDRDTAEYVKKRAAEMGMKMTAETSALFVSIAGSSLYVINNELAKLAARGRKTISGNDIEECVSPSTEYNVFLFHGYMLEEKYGKAFKILDSIRAVEKTFIPFVGLLSSKFFPMYMAKSCVNSGMTPADAGKKVAEQLHIHPYAAKMAVQESGRFKIGQLRKSVELLGDYDLALKSGGADARIENLVLKVYGVA